MTTRQKREFIVKCIEAGIMVAAASFAVLFPLWAIAYLVELLSNAVI